MNPSLKSHSCDDTLLETQDFTSLEVTAVLSLREKHFSSWIRVATNSYQICRSAEDFRVVYTELFFMQSYSGHFCISGLLWYPSRLWLCPAMCPSLCTRMKLGKHTWPEAAWEENKHISSLPNGKIISFKVNLHIDFPLARSPHCWNYTHTCPAFFISCDSGGITLTERQRNESGIWETWK